MATIVEVSTTGTLASRRAHDSSGAVDAENRRICARARTAAVSVAAPHDCPLARAALPAHASITVSDISSLFAISSLAAAGFVVHVAGMGGAAMSLIRQLGEFHRHLSVSPSRLVSSPALIDAASNFTMKREEMM